MAGHRARDEPFFGNYKGTISPVADYHQTFSGMSPTGAEGGFGGGGGHRLCWCLLSLSLSFSLHVRRGATVCRLTSS